MHKSAKVYPGPMGRLNKDFTSLHNSGMYWSYLGESGGEYYYIRKSRIAKDAFILATMSELGEGYVVFTWEDAVSRNALPPAMVRKGQATIKVLGGGG